MASLLARLKAKLGRRPLPAATAPAGPAAIPAQPLAAALPAEPPAAAPPEPPPHQFEALASLARRAGIDGLIVVMSFDCDTPLDAAAATELDPQLARRGVPRTYAVPGQMLLEAGAAYRRLAEGGAIFVNHGARPHAEWREDRYHGITFYNEFTTEEVVADIRGGDRIVREMTGTVPAGFRAPHFGYFQEPAQRRLIYDTARALGYRYCSDTLPAKGLEMGPVFDVGGLHEIPLTGSFDQPLTILDSWNYLADRRDYRMTTDYADQFAKTVNFFADRGLPALLNYYADPAHVANDGIFLQAIDHALQRGARFCSFETVLGLAGGRT